MNLENRRYVANLAPTVTVGVSARRSAFPLRQHQLIQNKEKSVVHLPLPLAMQPAHRA